MERGAIAAVFYFENPDPQKLAQALDEPAVLLFNDAPEQFGVFGRWLTNYLAGTAGEAAVTESIQYAPVW